MGFYGGDYCNVLFSCMFLALIPVGMASSGLSSTFYSTTCPKALSTIRTAVNSAVSKERRMGASLLRLHFHDCFVNASSLSLFSISIIYFFFFFSFHPLFDILFIHMHDLDVFTAVFCFYFHSQENIRTFCIQVVIFFNKAILKYLITL